MSKTVIQLPYVSKVADRFVGLGEVIDKCKEGYIVYSHRAGSVPNINPDKDGEFELLEKLAVFFEHEDKFYKLIILGGFTGGPSVPTWLRWIVKPSKILFDGFFHDPFYREVCPLLFYLNDNGEWLRDYELSRNRKVADRLMKRSILKKYFVAEDITDNKSKFTARATFFAIRKFGGGSFNKNKTCDVNKTTQ